MSKEPDNVILRLLRDIRDKQDVHDAAFAEVNRRLDEVHKPCIRQRAWQHTRISGTMALLMKLKIYANA